MKNYLLCIGIGQYANQGGEILSLGRVPKNDCNRLAEVLFGELYEFEFIQEPLFDEQASYDAIITALDGLKNLEEDSQTIVLFSGHGHYHLERNMSYWLAHDAVQPSDFDPYISAEKQGWIPANEIVSKINAAGSRHVLILTDCCFAGYFYYNFRGVGDFIYPDYAKLAIRKRSREILAPCGMTTVSTASASDSVSEFIEHISCKLKEKGPYAVLFPRELLAGLSTTPQYGSLQREIEQGGCFLFTSPDRLAEIIEEPLERDDLLHHMLCKKLEQKLQPISSEIDRSRYLDGFIGRQWVVDEVNAWIRDSSSKLFWLTGEPGVGKSAISAYLAEHNELIRAHHFFLFNKTSTLDLKELAKSLAYQLACSILDFADYIDQLDDNKLQKLDGQSFFDELIIVPLSQITTSPAVPIVMLLDGLDEATADGKNEIVEYLAKLLDVAPAWLKIILTSRPREHEIKRSLKKHHPKLLDTADPRNTDDLKLYLKKHLSEQAISLEMVDAILDKSEGSFLYIMHLCDDWQQSKQLPDIGNLPTGLSGIYEQFFRRKFPDLNYYEHHVAPFLELIVGAYEPLSEEELSDFGNISDREVQKIQRKFGSLVRCSGGKVELCHKSLPDWLTSCTSSEFNISIRDAQRHLVDSGWSFYEANPFLWKNYFLRHLIRHLATAHYSKRIEKLLLDYTYLEEKVKHESVYELLKEFSFLEEKEGLVYELFRCVRMGAFLVKVYPDSLLQNVCWQGGKIGCDSLVASGFMDEWIRYRKAQSDYPLIEMTYNSTSFYQKESIIYEVSLSKLYGRLLYADVSSIVYLNGCEFFILDTQTGRVMNHGIIPKEFYHEYVIYSCGRFYYSFNLHHIWVFDPELSRSEKIFEAQWALFGKGSQGLFPSARTGMLFLVNSHYLENRHQIFVLDTEHEVATEILCCSARIASVNDQGDSILVGLVTGELIQVGKSTNCNLKIRAHQDAICSINVTKDAIHTCSTDGYVKRWSSTSLELISSHNCLVGILSLSSVNGVLLGGGQNGVIHYWYEGKRYATTKMHTCEITDLFYIHELKSIVSIGSSDGRIIVSNLYKEKSYERSNELFIHYDVIQELMFSRCGCFLLIVAGKRLVSFDVSSAKPMAIHDFPNSIICINFSAENDLIYLATSDNHIYLIELPLLETVEESRLEVDQIKTAVFDDRDNQLFFMCDHGFGTLCKGSAELKAYYERKECRPNFSHQSMRIFGDYLFASSNHEVAIFEKNDLGSNLERIIDFPRRSDADMSVIDKSTVLLVDEESPVVSFDVKTQKVKDVLPFSGTDTEFLAANWKKSGCWVLGTRNDCSFLTELSSGMEKSHIPDRFDIIRKHPTKEVWAVAEKSIFRLLVIR